MTVESGKYSSIMKQNSFGPMWQINSHQFSLTNIFVAIRNCTSNNDKTGGEKCDFDLNLTMDNQ